MPSPFVAPSRDLKAFNCPQCGAYAVQYWRKILLATRDASGWKAHDEYVVSTCSHCGKDLMWHEKAILFPEVSSAPPASDDLPGDIKRDYEEAASIAGRSPRGAAAMLRLALQKLCIHLGEKGKDINTDIGNLVRKGLDARVQKALDTVRVIGNEAVHPGELDIRDDIETVGKLFVLLNAVSNELITQPRERDALYESLPKAKLTGIEVRDKKADATS